MAPDNKRAPLDLPLTPWCRERERRLTPIAPAPVWLQRRMQARGRDSLRCACGMCVCGVGGAAGRLGREGYGFKP
eukprot:3932623-Prymnesium_polylepis.1